MRVLSSAVTVWGYLHCVNLWGSSVKDHTHCIIIICNSFVGIIYETMWFLKSKKELTGFTETCAFQTDLSFLLLLLSPWIRQRFSFLVLFYVSG